MIVPVLVRILVKVHARKHAHVCTQRTQVARILPILLYYFKVFSILLQSTLNQDVLFELPSGTTIMYYSNCEPCLNLGTLWRVVGTAAVVRSSRSTTCSSSTGAQVPVQVFTTRTRCITIRILFQFTRQLVNLVMLYCGNVTFVQQRWYLYLSVPVPGTARTTKFSTADTQDYIQCVFNATTPRLYYFKNLVPGTWNLQNTAVLRNIVPYFKA